MAQQNSGSNHPTPTAAATTTIAIRSAPPKNNVSPSSDAISPRGFSRDALLESGDYSDLTIRCGQDVHKVHRLIVCPQSVFFEIACVGKFSVIFE